ncbi:MAG TPA: hypothetical protein H9782_11235 [Candidatus Bariatricus faecipullorum]|nr:hypothetical protein [Candidatus Bariatricus faecipullorum]
MELITGTAKTPHVTSTQHRAIYEMIIGEGSYILGKGELLEPELQSNNVLRIRSGMLCHHGSISEVKQNTYDEVNIGNGSQGMKRIDLVVARYTKNPETEIETMTWEVIQGTPAADSPVAPAYTEGNMQDGDLTDDCPLFEVHLDGIQVTEVVKLLEVLNGSLAELNSNLFSKIDSEESISQVVTSQTDWKTIQLQKGIYMLSLNLQLRSAASNRRHYLTAYLNTGVSGIEPIADIYNGPMNFTSRVSAIIQVENSGSVRLAYVTPSAANVAYEIYKIK